MVIKQSAKDNITFTTTATEDGNYPSDDGTEWAGGQGTFSAGGMVNATVKLQAKCPIVGVWFDVQSADGATTASFTSAGAVNFALADGFYVRANVSGASSEAGIKAAALNNERA